MRATIHPIRTEQDYESALARIEKLMDAEPGTRAADELEVLSVLVEKYEEEHHPMEMPDPVEAIRFRMEQGGLTTRELAPLLGGRAKVSEVLSGKRGLTLAMMRALNEHLGIPAEVLLQARGGAGRADDWAQFPVAAMVKAGWFDRVGKAMRDRAEELMRGLIERAGGLDAVPEALFRKGDATRQNAKMDRFALRAWCYQVLATARTEKLHAAFRSERITKEWARGLAKLSAGRRGPALAKEYLSRHGIHLVQVDHLPKTYLDGAAMLLPDGTPVIAVTLRYDRLDNFWFCLFHELAHVALHLSDKNELFIDDLSLDGMAGMDVDQREVEADEWAAEMLIPAAVWKKSVARERPTVMNVVGLAHELGIHPAIVAGRVRKERRNYRMLTQMVGNGEVRRVLGVDAS